MIFKTNRHKEIIGKGRSKFQENQLNLMQKKKKNWRRSENGLVWLLGFYGIPTFVGYLMPNPFLYKYSVLFQTTRVRMSTQFIFKNISTSSYSI